MLDFTIREGLEPKKLTDDALALLMKHDWPGNVRELKNIIERLIILTPSDEITAKDIPLLNIKEEKRYGFRHGVRHGRFSERCENGLRKTVYHKEA